MRRGKQEDAAPGVIFRMDARVARRAGVVWSLSLGPRGTTRVTVCTARMAGAREREGRLAKQQPLRQQPNNPLSCAPRGRRARRARERGRAASPPKQTSRPPPHLRPRGRRVAHDELAARAAAALGARVRRAAHEEQHLARRETKVSEIGAAASWCCIVAASWRDHGGVMVGSRERVQRTARAAEWLM